MDERDDTPPAGWADVPITLGRLVGQRSDGTEWSVEYDTALWVETGDGRGYIVGNAHTHPGRFHVYFPDEKNWWPTSVYQLTAMSAEARTWLRGFLSGSEPSLAEYLGRIGEQYAQTNEERDRWKNFNEGYRRDGTHPYPNKRPDRALVLTEAERAELHWQPWTYVGERVLIAEAAAWVEADPQPQMDGPWLAGSVCAERGHGNYMFLESGWSVCGNCGEAYDLR